MLMEDVRDVVITGVKACTVVLAHNVGVDLESGKSSLITLVIYKVFPIILCCAIFKSLENSHDDRLVSSL